MNVRSGNSFQERQARIERLHKREIAWRHKKYDYRTPAQRAAATKRRTAAQAREAAAFKEGVATLALVIILAIALIVGL